MWPYFTGVTSVSPRDEYVFDHLLFTSNFSACVYNGLVQVLPCYGGGAIRVGDYKLMVGTFGYAGHYGKFHCNATNNAHLTLCSLSKPCLFNVGTGEDEAEQHDIAATEAEIVAKLLGRFHTYDKEYHPDSSPSPPQNEERCRAVLNSGGWTSPWLPA
jgi:hypothetical protein